MKGRYRTADSLAEIEWELETKQGGVLVFSASGECDGSSGQCIDDIAKAYPDDEMVQRIHKVWQTYHLNDMQAGCEHQRALGWGHGKSVALIAAEITEPQRKGLMAHILDTKIAKRRLAHIKELKSRNGVIKLWTEVTGNHPSVHNMELVGRWLAGMKYAGATSHELATLRKINDAINNQAEAAHPIVIEDRIYQDSIGAPCPECGYCYGTEWKVLAIPAEVVAEIESWESNAERDLHLDAADAFLARHGLTIEPKRGNKPAQWEPAGHHYEVTLAANGSGTGVRKVTFDFWDSQANMGNPVTNHTILSCVAADIHTPESFEEFCREYGYDEDSRKAEQTFKRANEFARKLRAFFTAAQIKELQLIR